MKTFVEFRSDQFPPYEDEDEQVNPGRWGKKLAEFLFERLKAKGIDVLNPVAEDWGWVIPVANDEFRMFIGCGNYDEYPDGFLCFVEPSKPLIRRFLKKIGTVEKVQAVVAALEAVLSSEPNIRDVRWWTAEEINNPKAQEGA